MFKIYKKELDWGGQKLILETGKIAKQADGAVVVTYGETIVLCTVVAKKEAAADQGFFPLTVQYQEKYYAAGKIPGGFFRREAKPSDGETLVSRLIDRPIRPLFLPTFRNETQVICTVLSHDMETPADIPAFIGASAALTLSGLPFLGPVGAARVGYIDGAFVLNPNLAQIAESHLNLIVAGTSGAGPASSISWEKCWREWGSNLCLLLNGLRPSGRLRSARSVHRGADADEVGSDARRHPIV